MGKRNLRMHAVGMPTYNVFGWQKPCYLLQDGYVDTFQELLDTPSGKTYGTEPAIPSAQTAWAQRLRSFPVDHTFQRPARALVDN